MSFCKGFTWSEMKQESLFDLIQQAHQMLLDRSKQEQELIYHIAKLEPDLRGAIILAYQGMHNDV